MSRELMRRLASFLNRPIVLRRRLPKNVMVDPADFPQRDFPVYCRGCGHDLRGFPDGKCPECGVVFERGRLLVEQYALDRLGPEWRRSTACVWVKGLFWLTAGLQLFALLVFGLNFIALELWGGSAWHRAMERWYLPALAWLYLGSFGLLVIAMGIVVTSFLRIDRVRRRAVRQAAIAPWELRAVRAGMEPACETGQEPDLLIADQASTLEGRAGSTYVPVGACPFCGYLMDAGTCPECGRYVPNACLTIKRSPRDHHDRVLAIVFMGYLFLNVATYCLVRAVSSPSIFDLEFALIFGPAVPVIVIVALRSKGVRFRWPALLLFLLAMLGIGIVNLVLIAAIAAGV
jgi:hypothetical protein